MTPHLLLVTLGPVQEFIAEARRTRDLWYGSHILSELSRAAARALAEQACELIVPALEASDEELQPCLAPLRATGKPPRSIANKVLAQVPAGVAPRDVAEKVRAQVVRFWRESISESVRAQCSSLLAEDSSEVWDEQIVTFLEYTAAWAPLQSYREARRKVEAAVMARKGLRDFVPWQKQRGHVPKSSLDGARETVLAPARRRDAALTRRYRISEGEELDAVGLVKRAGGNPEQFVPVVNVAAASWLRVAERVAPEELKDLKRACVEAGVARVLRPELPAGRVFPFDASVLLPSRWSPVFQDLGLAGEGKSWGEQHVRPLLKRCGEPYPYVACLVADGDRVGSFLDQLGSVEAHRRFSSALSEFAVQARAIVEQDHLGALIYAGGDDLLAFLPVTEALRCAEALQGCFRRSMAGESGKNGFDAVPTLSVGLGLGHVMTSMRELLELGREAERLAKIHRNALAVVLEKRSGGTRRWSAPWDEDPCTQLRESVAALEKGLSARKVYEVQRTLQRLPPAAKNDSADEWARVLRLEVRRLLLRSGEGGIQPRDAGLSLDEAAGYAALRERVSGWVDRFLIARAFSRAVPRSEPRAREVSAL